MRSILRRPERKTNKMVSEDSSKHSGFFCCLFPPKKREKQNDFWTNEHIQHSSRSVTGNDTRTKESSEDEEFFTAQSLCCNDPYGTAQSGQLLRLKDLDESKPATIPKDAISGSTIVPPYFIHIPSLKNAVGPWKKDFANSTPTPNEVESLLNSSIFVQSVRKRISDFEIRETVNTFSFVVKIPIPGYKPRVECFKKNGAVVKLLHRRDDRSGTSCGQAFALLDGRIVVRVWNLGSSPEVMWQEIFEFLNPTKLKVEHSVFTLDGLHKAKKITIATKT